MTVEAVRTVAAGFLVLALAGCAAEPEERSDFLPLDFSDPRNREWKTYVCGLPEGGAKQVELKKAETQFGLKDMCEPAASKPPHRWALKPPVCDIPDGEVKRNEVKLLEERYGFNYDEVCGERTETAAEQRTDTGQQSDTSK